MTDLIKRDDAPKQIFVSQGHDGWRWPRVSKFPEQGDCENVRYIRADLVDPAAIREAALREAADAVMGASVFSLNGTIAENVVAISCLTTVQKTILALIGETK